MSAGRWAAFELAIVAAAALVATAPFHASFGAWAFLGPAALGALGPVAIAAFGRRRRLLIGETVAVSVPLFVLLGATAAGGVPSTASLAALFDGLVAGWVELLSVTPPVAMTATLRVLPFATAWLGAMIGAELLRSSRMPGLPVLGPVAALVVAVLVGAEERPVALVVGTALAVLGVVLSRVQQHRRAIEQHPAEEAGAPPRRRSMARVATAGALLTAVAALAPLVGPRLPLASANERFELRDHRTPPWNPLDVPSPLVQLKASLKQDRAEAVVFTVTADEPIGRWPLATLGSFDGSVWTVAEGGAQAAGSFVPVERALPPPPGDRATAAAGRPVAAEVAIGELGGSWLPRPGLPDEVELLAGGGPAGATAAGGATLPALRYNPATWTIAVPAGVVPGLRYRVSAVVPAEPDDAARAGATMVPDGRATELALLPPSVRDLAADLVEGEPFGWEQVAAIRDRFVQDGFYDRSDAARPGHSYYRLSEFLADPDRIVGYEEQYAAAAAVLARVAQVPTRVVVGYRVPDDRWVAGRADVLAEDISAWIEVRTEQYGWIPVDVTPDRSREPTDRNQGITVKNVAVPNPPPPPPPPQDVQLPEEPDEDVVDEDDEDDEDEPGEAAGGFAWRYVAYGAAGAAPLVLLAAALATVAALKARRSRRRRLAPTTSLQVAGAWQETVERYGEHGVEVPVRVTSRELAYALADGRPGDEALERTLVALAARVDAAAFAPAEPAVHEAAAAWELADRAVGTLHADRSRLQRYRSTFDPRPLLRRDATVDAHPKER